uniref:Cysteinyl-tRNA synthetase class Ia DALR domain-containing protein n=1 Tax=Sphenodon punctatus TaxID=8508 RepID=A0A8D0H710_SPHPU
MFCLLNKYRSGMQYGDDSMSGAASHLKAISSFISDANAYMKGQVVCEAVREDVLWERLAATKVTVNAALADDFDTPGAVAAIMDLIHHGNRQLKAVTKEAEAPRSALLYGTMISYIEQFLNTVGISLDERQVFLEDARPNVLSSVIGELVSFRTKVREYALPPPETKEITPIADTAMSGEVKQQQKEKRRQLLLEREPLLQACDSLRQDLAALGIAIKDRGSVSTWEFAEPREQQGIKQER